MYDLESIHCFLTLMVTLTENDGLMSFPDELGGKIIHVILNATDLVNVTSPDKYNLHGLSEYQRQLLITFGVSLILKQLQILGFEILESIFFLEQSVAFLSHRVSQISVRCKFQQ